MGIRILIGLMGLLTGAQLVSGQQNDRGIQLFFRNFQETVKHRDTAVLKQLVHYPFRTGYWVDGVDSFSVSEKTAGLLDRYQFSNYLSHILTPDVLRLIPGADPKRLLRIDVAASGSYYRELASRCDPDSPLYELYLSFTNNGRVGSRYFAFVFGRVNGEYKILAYYHSS